MDECDWTSCGALARLDLIAGSVPSATRVVGSFCVPHASMASLDVQEAGEPTWYDWHRERVPAEPAARPARQRTAAVIPLFQQPRAAAPSRSGQRVGRAQSR
jgi:hypothetical protein